MDGGVESDGGVQSSVSAEAVAAAVMKQAIAGKKLIIVSPNPLTWLLMPLTEWGRNIYNRSFTQAPDQ